MSFDLNINNYNKDDLESLFKSNDFKISPKLLEKHINKKTLWLILNSPGNPTGSVYSKQELHDLAIVLRNHTNVNIICDDIYSKIIYGNEKFFTCFNNFDLISFILTD